MAPEGKSRLRNRRPGDVEAERLWFSETKLPARHRFAEPKLACTAESGLVVPSRGSLPFVFL